MLNLICRTVYNSSKSLLKGPSLNHSRNDLVVCISILKNDFHTLGLSRNLALASPEPISKKKGTKQILESDGSHRPLILLYSWMMSKERHVMKFAKFYTDLGMDVLRIRVSPFDLLRPTKGAQVVADQVLDLLHKNNQFNHLLVHGFSVGAYVFCEMMVKISKNVKEHGVLLDRFVGQIWDSPVDIYGIPVGLSRALTNNRVLQKSCQRYLNWYLKFNYDIATKHYEGSSQKMHENYVNVPSLFIFSKRDVVSTPEMNATVYRKWEAKGTEVFTKCFESSPHVSHFYRYREDYEAELMAFLERLRMLHSKGGRAMV